MSCSPRSTRDSPELIADTNIVFSAILYPYGNPGWLLALACRGQRPVVLVDYIVDELESVFRAKNIPARKVHNFLKTYDNIEIHKSDDITADEIELARACVSDRKDRPLVAYALHRINSGFDCILVTGDKKLGTPVVRKLLGGRISSVSGILKMWRGEPR